ncbi:MAG: carboxymuconolactone decarboxylase family protein [Gammaproteobacteria bacterium]|nr:carboxymuconolactone decarboxylase family protein [Gammaproteobacteria bacterium]
MTRISPRARADAPELEDVFARAEKALGFVPNSFFVMARAPEIMRAFSRLSREVIGVPGKVPLGLKRLVAYMASRSAGCQYCSAHTAESAVAVDGVDPEKIRRIFEYETCDLFTEAERAALRMAQAAGSVPNEVTDADMDDLKRHFSEDEIVELVAAVCLFGWLNRWNDTMATGLEERPLAFGESHLAESGWVPGKHVKG